MWLGCWSFRLDLFSQGCTWKGPAETCTSRGSDPNLSKVVGAFEFWAVAGWGTHEAAPNPHGKKDPWIHYLHSTYPRPIDATQRGGEF